MLARFVVATATDFLAVPYAVIADATRGAGPSATPLLVELGAAALITSFVLARRPIARLARAARRRLTAARLSGKPARVRARDV